MNEPSQTNRSAPAHAAASTDATARAGGGAPHRRRALLPALSFVLTGTLLASLAMFAAACPREPGLECGTCQPGSICNTTTGQCEESALEPFEGELPGRAVRLAADGAGLALAAIEPGTGALVVGKLGRTAREYHVLHRFAQGGESTAGRKRLALTNSPTRVVVAFVDDDGAFALASRPIGAANDDWQAHSLEHAIAYDAADDSYEASEHFALHVDERQHVHLVFHDPGRRALRRLSAPGLEGPWQLETIDDGTHAHNLCPPERRDAVRRGVGLEPDVRVHDGEVYVAYHDADCGDLRLARRGDGRWAVSVVDRGASGTLRAVVGRFPSLAFDSRGRLAIAYQDVSAGRLMYAVARDGQFALEVADAGVELDEFSLHKDQRVGAFCRLAFDHTDTPRLVYMNGTRGTLRAAHRLTEADGRPRWVHRTLDGQGPVGFFADQLYDRQLGLAIAAERIRPTEAGLGSELVVIWEGRP